MKNSAGTRCIIPLHVCKETEISNLSCLKPNYIFIMKKALYNTAKLKVTPATNFNRTSNSSLFFGKFKDSPHNQRKYLENILHLKCTTSIYLIYITITSHWIIPSCLFEISISDLIISRPYFSVIMFLDKYTGTARFLWDNI